MVIWFTGLSGSGKTSIAKELLKYYGGAIHLDGDIMRNGLCSDLGFSMKDRAENIRRSMEVCKLFTRNNLIIATFITPLNKMREMLKREVNAKIVYIKCSLDECIKRDPKGLYKKHGDKMTGLKSKFEEPKYDYKVQTDKRNIYYCVDKIRVFIDGLK